MSEYMMEKMQEIFAIDSPTGYTQDAMDYLTKEVFALGFIMKRTRKGNGYVEIVGANNKYVKGFSAHIDTLGFMVRSISAEGKLKLTTLGGVIIPTVDGAYCNIYTRDKRVYTGTILSTSPASHVYPDATSAPRIESTIEVRIDEVVDTRADVLALGIQVGDFVCYDPKMVITKSGFIKSRFIDDKISVVILLELLKKIAAGHIIPQTTTMFLFSVYEEVGHGMSWLPAMVDELISVDMGCIGLDLSCSEYDVSICAKDSSGPYDYGITSNLIALAKEHSLPYAVDIYPQYGSDTSAALRGGNDIKGALIGPGVHASHGMERTHMKAVVATLELLGYYIEEIKE
ncbi:MAG: M42 family metallopeptidase [Culicoidibacterales bacterium]